MENGRWWMEKGGQPRRFTIFPCGGAAHALNEKWLPVPLIDVAGRDDRILAGSLYRKNERRLFVDIGDEFDPSETFALLIDAADRALGA
jgi:hypothetical protein